MTSVRTWMQPCAACKHSQPRCEHTPDKRLAGRVGQQCNASLLPPAHTLAVLCVLQGRTGSAGAAGGIAAKPATPPGQVVRRPEVIDDFVRNFFVRMGMSRTAEVFEAEWYELKATGQLDAAGSTVVPDIYLRNGVSDSQTHLCDHPCGYLSMCLHRNLLPHAVSATVHCAVAVLCCLAVLAHRSWKMSLVACGRSWQQRVRLLHVLAARGTSSGRSATSTACTTSGWRRRRTS